MTDVPFPAVSKEGPGSEGVFSSFFVDDGATVKEHQLIAEVQPRMVITVGTAAT